MTALAFRRCHDLPAEPQFEEDRIVRSCALGTPGRAPREPQRRVSAVENLCHARVDARLGVMRHVTHRPRVLGASWLQGHQWLRSRPVRSPRRQAERAQFPAIPRSSGPGASTWQPPGGRRAAVPSRHVVGQDRLRRVAARSATRWTPGLRGRVVQRYGSSEREDDVLSEVPPRAGPWSFRRGLVVEASFGSRLAQTLGDGPGAHGRRPGARTGPHLRE
jgi:hypothetical protein